MSSPAELVRLEIPAVPAFVGVARTVTVAVATSIPGIDDDRLEDLRIAVSEACTNAVEAHRSDAPEQRIVLRCLLSGDDLTISIEDKASDFDPEHLPERPDLDDPAQSQAERRWGFQLIRALVDEVAFADTDEGTSVTLTVRFDPSLG